MYRIVWKSGSLKHGKFAIGIADASGFEAAVVRGRTYHEAESRVRIVLAALSLRRPNGRPC